MTFYDTIFIIGILCSILLIVVSLICVITWLESRGNYPKIKFKSFKNFYALNKDRWKLYPGNVACATRNGTIGSLYYDAAFHFGFIDYYRYQLWKRRLDKFEEDNRKAEIIARMVAAVKKDIAASEENAQRYQNEVVRTLWSIINRSEE